MSKAAKLGVALLAVFIALQFIRPARNNSNHILTADMVTRFKAPGSVAVLLKNSCYDCHSNNTRYPWYANVQPIGRFLANHVRQGKEDLNLTEFTNYSKRRQLSKLKSIQNSLKDASMPLSSYIFMNNDAKLSAYNKAAIIQWTAKIIDSLSQ